ncbi:hypothetical protein ACFS5J_00065 [Flavobacterium chuncheonense]|uniref:Uncharacterized protein n=1 Tax=Flavobacterium chuncheonense TaxID=2026653 RepID=A0ABW5YH42_9FLAO
MESRLIYESDKTYLNKIQWIIAKNNTESEWCYLNPKTLNENHIEAIIISKLPGKKFYFVTNRKESLELNKAQLVSKIKSLYGKTEFKIWDENFRNVIEFKLEIYREGTNASR